MKSIKGLLLLVTITASAFAQRDDMPPGPPPGGGPGMKQEKIEAMKVGFITQKLDLSTEEAQKFWPVYNKYQDELKVIRESRRNDIEGKSMETMSDKDVEKLIDNELQRRQQEVDLIKKYTVELKKVIPTRKVALLMRLEEDFKREVLKRIQENRGDKPGGGGQQKGKNN